MFGVNLVASALFGQVGTRKVAQAVDKKITGAASVAGFAPDELRMGARATRLPNGPRDPRDLYAITQSMRSPSFFGWGAAHANVSAMQAFAKVSAGGTDDVSRALHGEASRLTHAWSELASRRGPANALGEREAKLINAQANGFRTTANQLLWPLVNGKEALAAHQAAKAAARPTALPPGHRDPKALLALSDGIRDPRTFGWGAAEHNAAAVDALANMTAGGQDLPSVALHDRAASLSAAWSELAEARGAGRPRQKWEANLINDDALGLQATAHELLWSRVHG